MNHMDPETRLVHIRLEKWAAWAKEREGGAWPTITPIGRMIECGPQGAASEVKPPISMPDEIAVIDAAVARLNETDRKVVIAYYVHWEPIEGSANRCHMRVRQFQRVLNRARWRLSGMLHPQIAFVRHQLSV